MLKIHIFPLDFDEKNALGGAQDDGIGSRKTLSVIRGPLGGPSGDRTFLFRDRVPPRSGPRSRGGDQDPPCPLLAEPGAFFSKSCGELPGLFGPISDPEAAIWTHFGAILDPYWTIWGDINVG